jgi:hypothetical protein
LNCILHLHFARAPHDMALAIDPANIYINLSGSAAAQSTFASTDPTAVYEEKRNAPVISDASKYQLAIVRLDASSRNLPLFVPSIASRDPVTGVANFDRDLTSYAVTLTLATFSSTPQTFLVPASQGGYLVCTSYYPNGDVLSVLTVPLTLPADAGMTDPALWAAWIQNQIVIAANALAVPDVVFKALVVTLDNSGRLVYTCSAADLVAAGYSFAIDTFCSLDLAGAGGNPPHPSWYGMRNITWVLPTYDFGTGNPYYSAGPWTMTSLNGVIVSPNACAGDPNELSATYSYTSNLRWIPQITLGTAPPRSPAENGGFQVDSLYYWGFDYQCFVDMVNAALYRAWDGVCALSIKGSGYAPRCKAPYVGFNAASKTFTMYEDAWGSSSNGVLSKLLRTPSAGLRWPFVEEVVDVQLNEILQNLLMFPASSVDRTGAATLNFANAPFEQTSRPASSSAGWAALDNDFSPTAAMWSPVGSLVMMTQFFPVRHEVVSSPAMYGGDDVSSVLTASTPAYDSMPVLSDVIPNITDASDWRAQTILYSPTVLRWIDMPAGAFPLDTLDIRLGWRNRVTGAVTPLTMNPMSSFSVKIQLRLIGSA